MRRFASKLGAVALCACIGAALMLGGCSSPSDGSEQNSTTTADEQTTSHYPVTVTDHMGRSVEVDGADRIATLCATGFDRMLVLGAADRVVGNFGTLTDWGIYCNGGNDVESLGGGNVAGDPDVETLNALGIDVLYCWQEAVEAGNVTDPDKADFSAVCAQLSTGNPTTVDEFKAYLESDMKMYSDVLASDEATARADQWIDYMNEKLDYVSSRTSTLSDDEIVSVYYARGGKSGDDALNAFLKYSYPDFAIQIAGGKNVADEADGESYGEVSAEQVAVWNPEYIFCGRIDSTDSILSNDAFAGTDAVRDGKVFLSPSGVMEWDTGSECILNTLYLAKTLHPDLFADLDMVKEIQEYYSTFYNTQISEQQAQNILDRMGPEA